MRLLHHLIAYLIIPPFTCTVAGLTALFGLLGDREGKLWNPLIRFWARTSARIVGITQHHIINADLLENHQGAVLMANHQSHLDPPVLLHVSKAPLRFLAKHTLFYFPFLGQGMKAAGHIAINRSNRQKAFASIDTAAQSIAQGKTILIFPEGTRSKSNTMRDFKKGGFVLAIKARVPIIPIGIAGTHEIFPPGFKIYGRGPVVTVIGDPIDTTAYSLEDKDQLIALVRQNIETLRQQAQDARDDLLAPTKPNEHTPPDTA